MEQELTQSQQDQLFVECLGNVLDEEKDWQPTPPRPTAKYLPDGWEHCTVWIPSGIAFELFKKDTIYITSIELRYEFDYNANTLRRVPNNKNITKSDVCYDTVIELVNLKPKNGACSMIPIEYLWKWVVEKWSQPKLNELLQQLALKNLDFKPYYYPEEIKEERKPRKRVTQPHKKQKIEEEIGQSLDNNNIQTSVTEFLNQPIALKNTYCTEEYFQVFPNIDILNILGVPLLAIVETEDSKVTEDAINKQGEQECYNVRFSNGRKDHFVITFHKLPKRIKMTYICVAQGFAGNSNTPNYKIRQCIHFNGPTVNVSAHTWVDTFGQLLEKMGLQNAAIAPRRYECESGTQSNF